MTPKDFHTWMSAMFDIIGPSPTEQQWQTIRDKHAEVEVKRAKSGFNPTHDELAILDFLNEKAGRKYRATEANCKLIAARMKEGASVADCKQVIVKKCREWKGDEVMDKFLRPATLFNKTKFDQYVGELVVREIPTKFEVTPKW